MNDMELPTKFVIVNLKSQLFGIKIGYVRSIEKIQTITELPNIESYVEGITQLREEVLPVLNLSKILGAKDITPLNELSRLISLNVNNKNLCFVVDSANEVLDIERKDIQDIPNLSKDIDFIDGIAKLDKRLIVLLNLEKLLSGDFYLPSNLDRSLQGI